MAGYAAANMAIFTASTHPKSVNVTALNHYLTGPALPFYDNLYKQLSAQGLAYRGKSDNQQAKLSTVISPTLVYLTACPKSDPDDPATEYYISTGKAVPTRAGVPHYRLDITMKKVSGVWKLDDLTVNYVKLCSS
jgi:hypothetical protein